MGVNGMTQAHGFSLSAEKALEKLKQGNKLYLSNENPMGNFSLARRKATAEEGQHPFAIVVTCSDSRVVPEALFSCGIGDLFVIRVAGNVIDDDVLGSIEYAASHLGCPLAVVLGHTGCGAVDAALHHAPEGHIRFITEEIRRAIGKEEDADAACLLNVRHAVAKIQKELPALCASGLTVAGAVYHLSDGRVAFD